MGAGAGEGTEREAKSFASEVGEGFIPTRGDTVSGRGERGDVTSLCSSMSR